MAQLAGCDGLLLIGASELNADLRYVTGFVAPDPFAFVQTADARILLLGDLELDRGRAQARADQVLSISPYLTRAREKAAAATPASQQYYLAVALALDELRVRSLLVPSDFPIAAADFLRQHGMSLRVAPPPLFPERAIKSAEELAAIQDSLAAAEAGMETAIDAVRAAVVGTAGGLHLDGELLTSERVRYLINRRLLELGQTARHTIVACGEAGCDPHDEGSGPLRAGEAIVIDIFPQSSSTGYYGDITRTIVRGEADEALRRQYDAVLRAQELALSTVCAGVNGRDIHESVHALFTADGYVSGEQDGRMQGFFHGTGHGLGLEIHEAPSISARADVLLPGQVVTVEPGLYYRGVGGVRIEDVVVVTDEGCTVLTSFPKSLEV